MTDRRDCDRFHQLEKVLLTIGRKDRRWARVKDESFTGIGVLLDDTEGLHRRKRVNLLYQGAPMKARIERIVPQEDDQFLVGLRWLESQTTLERVLLGMEDLLNGLRRLVRPKRTRRQEH